MLGILILLALPIGIYDGFLLIREKRWKELAAAGVLLSTALLIGIIKAFGMSSPLELLDRLIRPIGEVIFRRF